MEFHASERPGAPADPRKGKSKVGTHLTILFSQLGAHNVGDAGPPTQPNELLGLWKAVENDGSHKQREFRQARSQRQQGLL